MSLDTRASRLTGYRRACEPAEVAAVAAYIAFVACVAYVAVNL